MRSEHLDYMPLHCAQFGWLRTPPCNEVVTAIVGIVTALASTAVSIDSSQKQAKQAEYNAQAQSDALNAEAKRKAQETQENQLRATTEQHRQRAQQLAAQSTTGAMLGTGSELAVLADTMEKQHTQLADTAYLSTLEQRSLKYQASSALAMGDATAAQDRMQGYGSALAGLGKAAGAAGGLYNPGSRNGYTPAIGYDGGD